MKASFRPCQRHLASRTRSPHRAVPAMFWERDPAQIANVAPGWIRKRRFIAAFTTRMLRCLSHLVSRKPPFSVVSTGTWVIAMAVGGKPVTLDPARDTLVNVNAFGEAVPSARFMGGREHDLALGGKLVDADDQHMLEVLAQRTMLLPALVSETGPFAGAPASWCGAEPAIGSGQRSAAVGFYLALVTAHCLALIGHAGQVVVEGPFARNKPFLWMLGAASSSHVIPMESATGTSQGAALLAAANRGLPSQDVIYSSPAGEVLSLTKTYAEEWRLAVESDRALTR